MVVGVSWSRDGEVTRELRSKLVQVNPLQPVSIETYIILYCTSTVALLALTPEEEA